MSHTPSSPLETWANNPSGELRASSMGMTREKARRIGRSLALYFWSLNKNGGTVPPEVTPESVENLGEELGELLFQADAPWDEVHFVKALEEIGGIRRHQIFRSIRKAYI